MNSEFLASEVRKSLGRIDRSIYEGGRLMYVAKVRNGFVPHVRREVFEKLKGLETETCPFANLPEKKRTQWPLTREEMRNCHRLRAELVGQIEFTEWTLDGHLSILNSSG